MATSASPARVNFNFLGNGEPQKVFEHGCDISRSSGRQSLCKQLGRG